MRGRVGPTVVRDLARLVVPVACPGCGAHDVPWCPTCAGLLDAGPVRVEHDAPRLDRLDDVAPLPVWALAAYTGGVRELVVAWKDRGRVDLDRLFAPALARAAHAVAPALRRSAAGRPVLVVPAPSTRAARRERGRDHVRVLAVTVARSLQGAQVRAEVVPALRRRGRGRDQVGLGARARARNLSGAVVVREAVLTARAGGAAPLCVLVDDVVTTGSTLASAERALEELGADVAAALVLAATPPPDRRIPLGADIGPTVYRAARSGLAW